jgi:flagellar hook-basal body complex protein FliE
MADLSINTGAANNLPPIQPTTQTAPAGKTAPTGGKEFQSYLLDSLAKVNELQNSADEGVQKLMTGQTDNVAEALSASRKAGIAFDLLMEIRNKLMDAYTELKQMRV